MRMKTEYRMLPAIAAGLVSALGAATAAESPLKGAVVIKSQEAVCEVPVVVTTNALAWTDAPLRPDGDVSKWRRLGVRPVRLAERNASSLKGTYGGAGDLSADVYAAWDFDNLYLGVRVEDDAAPAPSRIEVAVVSADTPLIVGWRDVGQRYFADDVHFAFRPQADGSVVTQVYKSQFRMDSGALQFACGSETERRAQLDEGAAAFQKSGKLFACAKAGYTDIVIPWRTLQPLDPVARTSFKLNLAVFDADGETRKSVVALAPGLAGGVFSGVHFPVFELARPGAGAKPAVRALLAVGSYLMKSVDFETTVWSARPLEGAVEIVAKDGRTLVSAPVKVAAGESAKLTLKADSERLPAGPNAFAVRLADAAGKVVAERRVVAPTADDSVVVYHRDAILSRIEELKADTLAYSNLVEKVRAKGLDTVYPQAWLAILDMFIARCETDLRSGDTLRVIRNTDYLKGIYAKATGYAEAVLDDPSRQMTVPLDDPTKLEMRDGHFWAGDRPVFLWGPCLFWYLRQDAHYAWELGFNSVGPEIGAHDTMPKAELERQAYMKELAAHKIRVNASVSVPELQLTGADVKRSKLLQAHPELKNLDPNNFLSFIVQHPVVRQEIDRGQRESIAFWNRYPGICTLWLWNEPWYLNYSELTRTDFVKAMRRKYGDRIERLNKRWSTDYRTFDDIRLIQWPDPKNYAPWYDFQVFRDDLLANFFKYLHDTARRYRPELPTHTKFMAQSLSSFDIERFQEPYEIIGRDGNASARDHIYNDLFRSIAPAKPIVDTEVHIWYKDDPTVYAVAWKLALHGVSDGNWWCWHSNPRFSDSISNAQSMNALTMSGLDIRRLYADYVYPVVEKPSPVVTFFPSVCERRTDLKMVRMRFEVAQAQYFLGLRPFYATETTIVSRKALEGRKYLFAGESMWTKESTYRTIVNWVKAGGTLVTAKNGFNCNEYGDVRKTDDLILSDAPGEQPFGEYAKVYPLGKGRVIRIDAIMLQDDPVPDGAVGLRGSGTAENDARRGIYAAVLNRLLEAEGQADDVRVLPAAPGAPVDAIADYDWRAAQLKDGSWSLVVCPGTAPAKIVARRPIKSVYNLVDGWSVYEKPSSLNPFAARPEEPCEFLLPDVGGYVKVYRVVLED